MRLTLAMCALLLVAMAAGARADTGMDHVKVDLLADTTAVQGGKPFTVGVRFKIDAGWHIYWTNPGDSGLPTRVKLDLPAGYTAGPVQYPVPQVLRYPGDITNYGYESEVVLLVTVTPPPLVPTGSPVGISANATWLVCEDRCLPGRATAKLSLPVGTAAAANAATFAAAERTLPQPCSDRILTWSYQMNRSSAGPLRMACAAHVTWRDKPTSFDWIPAAVDQWDVDDVKVRTRDNDTRITFTLSPRGSATMPGDVYGLLVFPGADGLRTGVVISVYEQQAPSAGSATIKH